MVTQRDYTTEAVEATRSVLIEIIHILGEYRDNIVLIGGWVPELLFHHKDKPHIGSTDVDLAFSDPIEVTVEGELPGGGKDSVKVRVSSIVPFLVMKGMALDDRLKEKDAWDIYFCLSDYPGGLDALVDEFQFYIGRSIVKEGLQKIAKHFDSVSHVGPKMVADFEEITDIEARESLQRDAYEKVNYLMVRLGIKKVV